MKLLAGALALASLAVPQLAEAATTCTVNTSGLEFGSFSPLSLATAPRDANGDIALGCTWDGAGPAEVSYSIALSAGGAGSFAPRRMASGGYTLDYNVYMSDYATVWGDGSGTTQTVTGGWTFATASVQEARTHVAYGRIATGQQTAHLGAYSDTIVVTVSY